MKEKKIYSIIYANQYLLNDNDVRLFIRNFEFI